MPIRQIQFTPRPLGYVVERLSSPFGADRHILEHKPLRFAIVRAQTLKEEIDRFNEDAAPTLPTDDQIMNRIPLNAVIRPDLNKENRGFAANSFQNPFLYRGIGLSEPPVDRFRYTENQWKTAQGLLDSSAGGFCVSNVGIRHSLQPKSTNPRLFPVIR